MKNYPTNFCNKPEPPIRQSINRRKQLEDFISAVTKRVEVEEAYARNLYNIGQMVSRYTKDQNISSLSFSGFQLCNENRALQALTFSKALKEQVLQNLKRIYHTQTEEFKEIEKSVKRLQTQLNQNLDLIKKTKFKFLDIERNYEETLITYQIQSTKYSNPLQERVRLNTKSKSMYNQILEYQQGYLNAQNQYNFFRNKYYQQTEHFLQLLQKHQISRVQAQLDSVMRVLVLESSMIRNFEYDLKNISNQLDQKDIHNDILNFIEKNENKASERAYKIQNLIESRTYLKQTVYHVLSKNFIERIDFEKNKQIQKYLEKAFKRENYVVGESENGLNQEILEEYSFLSTILTQSWNGQNITQQQNQQFNIKIQNQNNRHFIYKYLRRYQATFQFKLSKSGFEKIYALVQKVILKCLEKKDIFIARKLINLTFAYYVDQIDNDFKNRNYLFTNLIKLDQLKSEDFWHAAIHSSIQEELYLIALKIENQQEAKILRKSTVLSQLAQFSHHIIMTGVNLKSTRAIIQKFCLIYEVDEDEMQDLSKCISTAYKQFKQKNYDSLKGQLNKSVISEQILE